MTKIMAQIVGRDGVSRKKRGVTVVAELVNVGNCKYKYRSDRVFNTEAMMFYGLIPIKTRIPTLAYNEDEIDPIDMLGGNDLSKRTTKKSAEEFGLMLEDAGFALFELLRKKNTNNENMLLAMLAGVLIINVIMLFAMFS